MTDLKITDFTQDVKTCMLFDLYKNQAFSYEKKLKEFEKDLKKITSKDFKDFSMEDFNSLKEIRFDMYGCVDGYAKALDFFLETFGVKKCM